MTFKEVIKELESLSSNSGLYSRDQIAWWLIKFENTYEKLCNMKQILEVEFPGVNLSECKPFYKESLFIELYDNLNFHYENSNSSDVANINLDKIIIKINSSINELSWKN